MGIEFWSINTAKLDCTANSHPASTAHPGAVYHDGVETDNGLNAAAFCQLRHCLHHGHGTDGYYLIQMEAVIYELPQKISDKSVVAAAPVVCDHKDPFADGRQFLLIKEMLTTAGSYQSHNPVAYLPVPPSLRVDDSRSYSAAHPCHSSHRLNNSRLTQWA